MPLTLYGTEGLIQGTANTLKCVCKCGKYDKIKSCLCVQRTYNKRHELRWRGFGLADSSHHHRGVSQLQKDIVAGYTKAFRI